MYRNRIAAAIENYRLPQPPAPAITPCGFMMCMLSSFPAPAQTQEQWAFLQWIYQRAFEQAQAVVRPSLLERDLLAVWN